MEVDAVQTKNKLFECRVIGLCALGSHREQRRVQNSLRHEVSQVKDGAARIS